MTERIEKLYTRWGAMLLAALSFAVMLCTLYAGEMIGLSNNGDFYRVIHANHLQYINGDTAFLFLPRYQITLEGATALEKLQNLLFSTEFFDHYPSIHHLFVRPTVVLAFAVGKLTGNGGIYSLAYLGVLYCVLYALLLWGLFDAFRLPRMSIDLPVKLAMLVVLCDVGYIAYFDSFYGEAVQIIGMLAMAVSLIRLLRKRDNILWFALFCLSSLLYGWAKFANIPAALIAIVCVSVPFLFSLRGKRRLLSAIIPTAALAILCAVVAVVPAWMSQQTDYNAVFFGALKDVPEAEAQAYAEEFGLSDYAFLAGTNYYVLRVSETVFSPELWDAFHVGKLDMGLFYLRHPALLLNKLTISVNSAGFVRPYYLANYDGSHHARLTFSSRFSAWSALRERTSFDEWWLNLAVFAVAVPLLFIVTEPEKRGILWPLSLSLMLAGMLAYSLASPVLFNGEGDLAKHMFSFVQLMDALVLFNLVSAVYLLLRRSRNWCSVAALALLCVMLLVPAMESAAATLRANRSHAAVEPGSYVSFGQYTWLVTDAQEDSCSLLAAEPVTEAVFSADNVNLWSESDLRSWLNSDFLAGFTAEERAMLCPVRNRYVLSVANEALSEDGDSDLYAFHTPRQAYRGENTAVAAYADDLVYLPDLTTVCAALNRGDRVPSCWLETPYFSNGQMQRILAPDGYLYMRDAKERYPVAPCITVNGTAIFGSGSRSDPFVLQS